jgi:acetyl esterase/lipase
MTHHTPYHDLIYAHRSAQHRLDLYRPDSVGRCPLIVWVHGGAFRSGDKAEGAPLALVDHGYALASVNYRLSQEALFPAQIHDVKAAVRWLRAHADQYRLDPDLIGAWGPSAGGHLVAMLGISAGIAALEDLSLGCAEYSSAVQAVVDWFGPTDFLQMDAQAVPGSLMLHDPPDSPESQLVGGPIQKRPDRVAQANPVTHIRGGHPPFLIQHGTRDLLVPCGQSQLLHDALTAAGSPSTLELLPGAGHGGPAFDRPEMLLRVVAFFDQHLR